MWKRLFALTSAVVMLTGAASAQMGSGHTKTAHSGVETQVHLHRGNHQEGIHEGTKFKVQGRPANGTVRIVTTNLTSGTGKPIRVAQVLYKSKKGFVGSDSFSYQRINRNGAVDNFTLSVSVVP